MNFLPNCVVMVRPMSFGYNNETGTSNFFQKTVEISNISTKAVYEFDNMVKQLRDEKIEVLVLQDEKVPQKPDAVFPNNWFSIHEDYLVLYPMLTENRRIERDQKHIEKLQRTFGLSQLLDLTIHEPKQILEGTGSLILDRTNRVVYMARSSRSSVELLNIWCDHFNYTPIIFDAVDEMNRPIYHTNVLMTHAIGFTMICLDSIKSANQKEIVTQQIEVNGNEIVALSQNQIQSFAGNALAIFDQDRKMRLAISKSGWDSLRKGQQMIIEKYTQPIVIPIPTIETIGGGSVRCMMAEAFS